MSYQSPVLLPMRLVATDAGCGGHLLVKSVETGQKGEMRHPWVAALEISVPSLRH
jgi:hypothetical protein